MHGYVVDTSSLIDIVRHYPEVVFPGLWKKIDALVVEGRMTAPWQVYKEIEQKHDELYGWARNRMVMFKKNTRHVAQFAAKLSKEHRQMSGRHASVERADPYVIALAYHTPSDLPGGKAILVTEERTKAGQISQIASLYGLTHLELVGMMLEEKWSFG